MSHDVAMDILPIFMIIAVTASIFLGYLLGCEGTLLAQRMAAAAIKRATKARRVARRAEGERALAWAERDEALRQRDDARAQLERANAVIDETTHAVHRAGSIPDLVDDNGTTALMDAVTDGAGRALGSAPAGRHHAGGAE